MVHFSFFSERHLMKKTEKETLNQPHLRLTLEERCTIETLLNEHRSIRYIAKQGRLYKDYLYFIANSDLHVVQMDCVEGKQDEKATLLTLHFPGVHMQLAYIMDNHTSKSVVAALDKIETALGSELFAKMFPVILTDNGSEFTDIPGMERSITGGQRTRIFFCEPNRSDEKGACENNHKLIRYISPKGCSLEPYSQSDINLAMNHINSYNRKATFGKSPYDIAMQLYPEDFFIFLGLEKILPEKVILKPTLFITK